QGGEKRRLAARDKTKSARHHCVAKIENRLRVVRGNFHPGDAWDLSKLRREVHRYAILWLRGWRLIQHDRFFRRAADGFKVTERYIRIRLAVFGSNRFGQRVDSCCRALLFRELAQLDCL